MDTREDPRNPLSPDYDPSTSVRRDHNSGRDGDPAPLLDPNYTWTNQNATLYGGLWK